MPKHYIAQPYIAPQHQATLALNKLTTFNAMWDVSVDWFEDPNERRGGWSGVGRMDLPTANDAKQGVFLKRQQNHNRKTWLHPIRGIPTFACEFKMMQLLASKKVPTLVAIFFGVHRQNDNQQAALMTEELAGFQSLEDATEALFASKRPSLKQQRSLITQVAHTVGKLHRASVQHRSLYPKHLFVDKEGRRDVVVIDLEKSRTKWLPVMRALYDLSTLNRHAKYWSNSARLYFYKQYFGVDKLNVYQKWLLKMIVKRSLRQKKHSTVKKVYQGQK